MKINWIVSIIVLVSIVVALLYGLGDLLSLEYLKQQQASFQLMYIEAPTLVVSLYFLLYVLVATFSIPGAAILTIGCGTLFGFFLGTLIASFASSIGSLLAFLVVRSLAQDVIQKKFSKQLTTVNKGIQEDGAFYLFGLRLVPVLPFFLVNILMALTPIKTWIFYSVSQVGMLVGTMVYVNAGTRLADIESLSGILDPQLVFAFLLLAIFPVFTNKLMQNLNRKT